MARIDFRVQPGFFRHWKTIALREACGEHAVLCLLQLWAHAAENAPDGNLDAMSDPSIEIAAGWIGRACEKGKFVEQLRNPDSLFLDGRQLHDWQEHQPFLAGHLERSKKAKHAARMRWACSVDAKPCGPNAPSPSPLPLPSPSPSPKEEEIVGLRPSDLKDLWNKTAGTKPQVKLITWSRERAMRLRLKEHPGEEFWTNLFEKINQSDFLSGRNNRNWRATFDFAMKPANIAKILEGTYDNRESAEGESCVEVTQRIREKYYPSIQKPI